MSKRRQAAKEVRASVDEVLEGEKSRPIASTRVTHDDLRRMAHDQRLQAALTAATNIRQVQKAKSDYWARKEAAKADMAKRLGGFDPDARTEAHINIGQVATQGEGATSVAVTASAMKRLRELVRERIERRREALKCWRPLPVQEKFQRSTAKERVVYGSNRSGKTTVSAVEVALIVTGQHPKLSGTRLPTKDGIACLVGYDYSHVGRVLYRKLFKPGAFRVIQDKETGEFRPYEPDGKDKGVPRWESRPAPPLIPKRYIKPGGINWYRKKEGIPKTIKLINGWELRFYSSEGEPPQGDSVHLFWLDEEMINEAWYTEASRGITDESGFFIWSATPHVGGDALIDLHERAEKCKHDPNGATREFLLLIFDNQHIAENDKNEFIDKLRGNPEAYRTRILGEFAAKAFKVYSEFSMDIHGFSMKQFHGDKIPDDWCRYAAIDPGHQVTAVLFLAVPPPGKHSYRWYVYDELYLEKCSPTRFAEAFEQKTRNQSFEAWIIDMRAGRVTTVGGEKPVEQIYREALYKVKVKRDTGRLSPESRPGGGTYDVVNCWERVKHQLFYPGADNPKAGISAVKEALTVQISTGYSQLVFAKGEGSHQLLPWLEYEFAHYHHKRVKGKLTDELSKKDDHLMDCFDEATQVLTEGGWRYFRDLTGSERLATVDLATDEIEYQLPTALINKPYDGDMIAFGGHKLDALVTPGHRMVVYERGADEPVIKLASDLSPWDRIKLNARWTGELVDAAIVPRLITRTTVSQEKQIDPGDFAEFLGWYAAEGSRGSPQSSGRGYQVIVSQKKQPHRDRLKALLSRLPWKWHENKDGFYCSSKQLWLYIGQHLPGYCYEKSVPTWIKGASTEIIERFIRGVVMGDGWTQGGRLSHASTSERLADDLQELFIKCGRSASIRVREPAMLSSGVIRGRQVKPGLPQFWTAEWKSPYGLLRDSRNAPNFGVEQDYLGRVYCATVPNGTLIVRRNGKPMIAGNCLRYLVCAKPEWQRPKKIVRAATAALKRLREKRARLEGGSVNTVNLGPRSGRILTAGG